MSLRNNWKKKAEALQAKLEEVQGTLRAIQRGGVDALVVADTKGERVYTLTSAERPYRIMVETMNEGAATLNSKGLIFYSNQRFSEMLKTPLEKVIGSSIYDWISSDESEKFNKILHESKKKRSQYTLSLKSGLISLLSLSPVEVEGKPGVCLIAADLTEQKKFEQARSEVEQLKQSEEQFRLTADAIPQLAFIAGTDGNPIWYNRRWYEYTGMTSKQTEDLSWQSFLTNRQLSSVKKRWQSCAATGDPFEMEIQIRGADGKFRTFLTRAMPIRNREGQIERWFGTNTDIDELKRLHQACHEAKEEAEKANRTKDLFLATLSHELRTPLTSVLSWAQLLKSGKADSANMKTGLQAIEDSALSLNQLIGDLLDISRINAGKIALEFQNLELNDVVRKAVDALRGLAEKKSIQLNVQLETTQVFVRGDAERMKQILWNLLSNSIKFTSPGGKIEVALEVMEDSNGPKVQVRILDTGKGIPPAFLPHLFSKFSQADSSSVRVHGGLGLGLALVHRLVKLQGGTVEAQSDGEGKGATFRVNFPLLSLAPFVKDESKRPMESPVGPEGDLSGVKVLLVDDEPSTLLSIKEVLSSFGAQVRTALSAEEAIAEFERCVPDVMISDLAMPVEDGYSLIRKVRQFSHEKGGDTPAVALTAYADSQSRALALAAGYQEHLAKPVDSDKLVRTILSKI